MRISSGLSRRSLYIGVFLISLISFIVINIPFTAFLTIIQKKIPDLTWQAAYGTVWDGQLENIYYKNYYINDAHIKSSAFQIVTGRWISEITAKGPYLDFEGQIGVSATGSVTLKNSDIRVNLSGLDIYDIFDSAIDGELTAEIDHLHIRGQVCKSAELNVWTNILYHSLKIYDAEGFDLEGLGMCDHGPLNIRLAGQRGSESVDIAIGVDRFMAYDATASVTSADPRLRQSLRLLGFNDHDGLLMMTWRGDLFVDQ